MVGPVTTLAKLPSGQAIRCDRCRLVWPVAFGPDSGWLEEPGADLHLCPRCQEAGGLSAEESSAVRSGSPSAKARLALSGPGSSARLTA